MNTARSTAKVHALFAYGSLIFPEVMRKIIGKTLKPEKAQLQDYQRCALRGSPYPAIVPRCGSVTIGVIYCGLTTADLEALDEFEGNIYVRRSVTVATTIGSTTAEAFILNPEHTHTALEMQWDPDDFERNQLPLLFSKQAQLL